MERPAEKPAPPEDPYRWGEFPAEPGELASDSWRDEWRYELVRTFRIPDTILPKDPELSLEEWLVGEGLVVNSGISGT